MTSVHLLGGGWDDGTRQAMYRPFATEVLARGGRLAYILQNGTPGRRFLDVFAEMGLTDIRRITISAQHPVTSEGLDGMDGLFVAGGVNPLYQRALAGVAHQIRSMVRTGMPYAGFSAGSVVAARSALVGGWLLPKGMENLAVCPERRSEGLRRVTVTAGLGLVPFAVDVHGTQWGTLSRAVHAVDAGLVDDCVLVDENTVIHVHGDEAAVAGTGSVYRLRRDKRGVRIMTYAARAVFAI